MEWLYIQKDDSRTRKLFLDYHHYEWRTRISTQKLWHIVLPIAITLFTYNILSDRIRKDYDSFFFTSVSLIVIMYLPMKYFLGTIRLYKSIKRISAETPPEFKFRYDEQGTFYQDHEMSEHQSWNEFKYYSVNKSEIYLYNHQGFVQQIIAERIIGTAHYERVLKIIQQRLKKRNH
jgi:hypothetical protein